MLERLSRRRSRRSWQAPLLAAFVAWMPPQDAMTLDERLLREPRAELIEAARTQGDARRGAAVFFQPGLACARCHAAGEPRANAVGPDLATLGVEVDDVMLVEALLEPSRRIRDGFRGALVELRDGSVRDGIVVRRDGREVVLRDAASGVDTTLPAAEVVAVRDSKLSAMPAGQMTQLASRQQFLDLVRWLIEVREGGAARARELAPPPELRVLTLPAYESRVDHAALIRALDAAANERGAAIYQRVCANCHGTREQAGSLPNSLRFASGRFKNGSDPLALYRTLTHGFGPMPPQTWMVPRQKYDVIHYLREAYLRPHNTTQYVAVDADYLAALPPGDTLGPEPSTIEPWSACDYGASLAHTYEVPDSARPGGAPNFAYKGLAVRLDDGAGGVARGRHWLLYDLDTLRVAAAWSAPDDAVGARVVGARFIDWRGIQLNGEHQIHPKLVGALTYSNPIAPGFAEPGSGRFVDDQRVIGRDGRRYGPLPKTWARLRGIHLHGAERLLDYTVGTTEVLEMPAVEQGLDRGSAPPMATAATPRFVRHFQIGPRATELVIQVAQLPPTPPAAPATRAAPAGTVADAALRFDGATWIERPLDAAVDIATGDFTIAARIRTTDGGTIVALAAAGPNWTPDGQTLFVRDGRLCFDIGWVGCITSHTRVDDGAWHDVAATWRHADSRLELVIDGRVDAAGTLAPKSTLPNALLRIGFTAPDFPAPQSYFRGEIESVRLDRERRADPRDAPDAPNAANAANASTVGHWTFADARGEIVVDRAGREVPFKVRRGDPATSVVPVAIRAGFAPIDAPMHLVRDAGELRLVIEPGAEPLRFSLWCEAERDADAAAASVPLTPLDLASRTHGGPPRCPEILETRLVRGREKGPFAVDVLELPDANPWLAQIRPTGLDFMPDGRMALSTWDGDVWLVEIGGGSGLSADGTGTTLRWRRIVTGLFQPLGLKVVDGLIHLTCRDQLAVLHDLNGDDEIDFIECLNSDHQVTEHFHEFAMGLECDAAGNFVYAKSGRHALDSLVPQHGTVLRVSRDGSRTDVLARGLRAANGICVNPDGSFVVTDQEGFWIPKNRINWITPAPDGGPRFYGNMFGWHDGVAATDEAMEPPLCWLTNDFDRSPAEALWVRSAEWGALDGGLLCSSYGEGKLFVVLHEPVPAGGRGAPNRGVRQGGAIALPGATFPTGVLRGRFASRDGALYTCGMFAWAGDATQPGGLYRVRATGRPLRMPIELATTRTGLRLRFAEPLERATLAPASFQMQVWSLRRTANYGSAHHDEHPLTVRAVRLAADDRTVELDLEGIAPTWCYELRWQLRAADGGEVNGVLHGTLHALPE